MAIRVIDDTKLNNIAVAIQEKDNGGQMTVDEMPDRIDALPTGGTLIPKTITENGIYNAADDNADGYDVVTVNVDDFDMSVVNNQIKMVIEVDDSDLSFWTRFALAANSTVYVDWGDRTVDTYTNTSTNNQYLDYARSKKHQYQKAGIYLVTITAANGTFTVGSINGYSTLSEGPLSTNEPNAQDIVRRMYNAKLKEISLGDMVPSGGITNVPYVKIHGDIYYIVQATGLQNNVRIKDGVTSIRSYWFATTLAQIIKIPSSITTINESAFNGCYARIIDFTDIVLNDHGELPFSISTVDAFRGSDSTILLFKTQEIAEVAKRTTNLSVYASRIKFEGEEY